MRANDQIDEVEELLEDSGLMAAEQNDDISYEATRDASMYNNDIKFESESLQMQREQLAMEESARSSIKTRLSHKEPCSDDELSLDLDHTQVKSVQRDQDMNDIDILQKAIDAMASRMTIQDIEDLTSIGVSQKGSKNFEKEFYQMSMRPTIISNESQKLDIDNLQNQIASHAREIELLKKKLRFKNHLAAKVELKLPLPHQRVNAMKMEKLDTEEIFKLGLEKMKKDTEGDCNVFWDFNDV